MCGLGNETYPKFLPPALNFLLQILKVEKDSKTKKMFCCSLPTSEFEDKGHIVASVL